MKARQAGRALRQRPERGAGALEWVAIMVLASILVGAVAVAVKPAPFVNVVRQAICTVLGMSGDVCAPLEPETREPTEPRVTGRTGLDASMSVAVAVDLDPGPAEGRAWC